ncbi:MAG: hypothetical protein RL172_1395 [Bacteroidota bacterium]|jgi:hypothetical protein
MKWISVNNQRHAIQEYQLMQDGQPRVTVKFNALRQSARVICKNQQRLFFIESAGALSGRYIFKNEYGIEIGQLTNNKANGYDGEVIINQKKYCFKQDTGGSLAIFDNGGLKPLVTCLSQPASYRAVSADNKSLLLGLCWYLLLPAVNEKVMHLPVIY